MIVVKNLNSQKELVRFLNKLDISNIIISIIKDNFERYEVYYRD